MFVAGPSACQPLFNEPVMHQTYMSIDLKAGAPLADLYISNRPVPVNSSPTALVSVNGTTMQWGCGIQGTPSVLKCNMFTGGPSGTQLSSDQLQALIDAGSSFSIGLNKFNS